MRRMKIVLTPVIVTGRGQRKSQKTKPTIDSFS